MDTSEYLPMFVAECREHLQELNLAIVRIEETPDDRATIDEIFRIAHSLKGMSATMGFARMAALTHQMEDVFELFRQGSGSLGREGVDVLLACLDALGTAVDAIDADGAEQLEHEPLVARLHGLVGEAVQTAAAPEITVEVVAEVAAAAVIAEEGARRVLRAVAHLHEDVQMPSVRAYMVLAAVGDHGEIVHSVPSHEEVDAFSGRVVEIHLASDHEEEAVEKTLNGVPDVVRVDVGAPDAALRPEADTAASEPAAGAPTHAKKTSSTVRVDAERLDQLMHLMGELVVHRTHVESLAATADVPGLAHAMQDLTRSSQALQSMVMQVRMIPVEAVLLRFPRLVRDLSSKFGKQVDLVLSGKETELDRTVVEALGDPLVHLVRNSLDHGLETPEERIAAGKPAAGRLEIEARHAGGNVVISVRDDGRGVDAERIARKAAERGLIPADAVGAIDTRAAVELLFSPGFSTAEQTSDVSGRGVGMDAVRTTIRALGGEVLLTSEPGRGTTAQIRLPLTLAIMAALLVETGGMPFAVQLDRVETTLRLDDHPVRSMAGRRMLMLRDGVLPLYDLSAALGYGPVDGCPNAVIVHGNGQRVALEVEHLVGQRELVTRPLPKELADSAALSGGAVLSSGEIALIVDCDALGGSGAARAAGVVKAA